MYLRYFIICTDDQLRESLRDSMSDKNYCKHLEYRVFFIGYYLSLKVRKLKFETDGTFNTIVVKVGSKTTKVEITEEWNNLIVYLPFDRSFYDNATQAQKYEYYMDLIKMAINLASRYKSVPKKELLELLQSLIENNFVYSWNFKNVQIKELGLKIKFISELSTNDYILKAVVYKDKKANPICEGVVARTVPDSEDFSYISKKILVKDNKIIIYSEFGDEIISIQLDDLIKGNLTISFSPSPNPTNHDSSRTFYYLQNMLRYDNNEFR